MSLRDGISNEIVSVVRKEGPLGQLVDAHYTGTLPIEVTRLWRYPIPIGAQMRAPVSHLRSSVQAPTI